MLSTQRCKACGGDVEINASLGIGKCQYCGSKQPLSADDINAMNNAQKAQRMQNIPDSVSAKKHRRKILLPVIIITIIIYSVVFASTGNDTADVLNISAHMTTALDSKYNAVDTVNTYDKNADKLIYVAVVNGIEKNTNVKVMWLCEETVLNITNIQITPEKNSLYAYITPADKQWTAGAYYVELYIDYDTDPIDIVNFQVK